MLVNRGSKVNGLNKTALHPRTAFGVNRNGRYVYLVVVDGRETSEGVTMDELADILLRYGAHTALAFDGGGSSTMVVEGVDGKARVVNNPVEANTPGNERAVANHLGIGLKK
jgi:exopolysaccharide biosynthesis protein